MKPALRIMVILAIILGLTGGLVYLGFYGGEEAPPEGIVTGGVFSRIVDYWSRVGPEGAVQSRPGIPVPLSEGPALPPGVTVTIVGAEAGVAGGLPDYSAGNFQVEGVVEDDIAGFNGTHVFVISDGILKAVRVYPPGDAGEVWSIQVDSLCSEVAPEVRVRYEILNATSEIVYKPQLQATGLIVDNGVVYVFCDPRFRIDYWIPNAVPLVYVPDYDILPRPYSRITGFLAINSSDGSLLWSSFYTGSLIGARLDDRGLVIVTSEITAYFVNGKPVPIAPIVDSKPVGENEIMIVGDPAYYTIVALMGPSGLIDFEVVASYRPAALVMAAWGPVVSAESWDEYHLLSFEVSNGTVRLSGVEKVPGRVRSQWQLQPYQDYLIVVYDDTGLGVGMKIFRGPSLTAASSITGIITNQNIHGVRIVGDIIYFVTFRAVDPLFAVNISDPENPVLLGYLEAPGFDDYLHPTGHGLLGVGLEAWRVRVSLYKLDNGVPEPIDRIYYNVSHTLIFEPGGHKAFTYIPSHDLALIPLISIKGISEYHVVRISPDGLSSLGVLGAGSRAYYVGDVIVVVCPYRYDDAGRLVALYNATTLDLITIIP